MKPMNFSCILRLSKSQMTENVYKDAVVEQVWPQTPIFSVSSPVPLKIIKTIQILIETRN